MLAQVASRLRVPSAAVLTMARAAKSGQFERLSSRSSPVTAAPARAFSVVAAPQPALLSQRHFSPFVSGAPQCVLGRAWARSLSTTSDETIPIDKVRNVAIIAHVDHGKTTLVDKMLSYAGIRKETPEQERLMDCNALEQERGITILAKNTSVRLGEYKINILDTPGHGDFGGEVERILGMVDGVVLLVDASEGPMPQTKFVLSKALKKGLRPIVVLNKMDRPTARPDQSEAEIFELFAALGATDDQLNYPTLYASSREGWVAESYAKIISGEAERTMKTLFDTIISYVPQPQADPDGPFRMLVTTIGSDQFLGRILTGRVLSGSVKPNDKLHSLNLAGAETEVASISRVMGRQGMDSVYLPLGQSGDIVSISGFSKATVSETICAQTITEPIKADPIDPPVLSMVFGVNKSPLSGREGSLVTSTHIQSRLNRELESNITLQILPASEDGYEVRGRGELQLGILIENMRREGFELSISPPRVIYRTINGKTHEPVEEVVIDVDSIYSGSIIEKLSKRKGNMIEIKEYDQRTRLVFHVPSRGLLGLRSELLSETRGTAVMNHLFHSYEPFLGDLDYGRKGVIVSMAQGTATAYALKTVEARGILFIEPGTEVYAGMIIGESNREDDIDVNPVKAKALTNFRTVIKDDFVRLVPPRRFTLEDAISYVLDDELIEVTPKSIRLRKKILDTDQRIKARK